MTLLYANTSFIWLYLSRWCNHPLVPDCSVISCEICVEPYRIDYVHVELGRKQFHTADTGLMLTRSSVAARLFFRFFLENCESRHVFVWCLLSTHTLQAYFLFIISSLKRRCKHSLVLRFSHRICKKITSLSNDYIFVILHAKQEFIILFYLIFQVRRSG